MNLFIIFILFELVSGVLRDLIPNYREVLGLIQERNVEREKLQRISKIRDLFNALAQRQDLESLRLSEPYFETYLPSRFRDYEVLAVIDGILRGNGFRSQNLTFSEGSARLVDGINLPLIREHTFSLPLEGSYNAISQVIRDLETNSRVFVVKQVAMERSDKTPGLIHANLSVATYTFTSVSILP